MQRISSSLNPFLTVSPFHNTYLQFSPHLQVLLLISDINLESLFDFLARILLISSISRLQKLKIRLQKASLKSFN